jgi:transmembrane sensor
MFEPKQHISPELLAAYLTGQISTEDAMVVEKWVEYSLENRQYFDEYVKLWEETGKIDPPPIFVDTNKAWNIISDRIDRYEQKRAGHMKVSKQKLFTRSFVFRIAAVLLIPLISILGYLLIKTYTHQGKMLEITASSTSVYNILPDGTSVTLNSNSSLTYPAKFNRKTRTVLMKGEVFFDVIPDKNQPFIVCTENTEIFVTGTKFNVRSYADEPEIVVYVESGTVIMKIDNSESGQISSIALNAGEKGIYYKTTQQLEKFSLPETNDLFWINKTLIFNRTPLFQVISDIEKNYNVTIDLKHEQLKTLRLTSSFENENIDTILHIIAGTFDLKLSKEDTHFILENDE